MSALLVVLTAASPAAATPNPWPFDFDPQIAEDPATIQQELSDLGTGLPGLRDDEMVESEHGPVKLYWFAHLIDALDRARDSGPGTMPPVVRNPVLCSAHDSFVYPTLLVPQAGPTCQAAEASIAAAFDGAAADCLEVEFPEVYVFDHPPGVANVDVVSSFEGLIALAGEALRHIDYPTGILPDDFFTKLRPIIAKIRYTGLIQRLDERIAGYASALQQLNSSASCFDPTAKAAFETTVGELDDELTQAKQQLEQLYQDGLTAAAADRAAMEALCRARNDLPHPALTDEERILLSFYLGGIYWRARGAGLIAYPPDPDQGTLRRILYARYPFQLIGDLTGGVDAEGVGNTILFDENWGWAEWWDMGNTPGSEDKYYDLVLMTKRGKRSADLTRPNLEGRGYDVRSFLAGAMQMGPCYYYGWEHLRDFHLGEDLQDPYMWFIEWPGSLGEVCTGAALAEGLARTMLWGTPIPEDQCVPDPGCTDGSCGGAGVGGGLPGCGPCPEGEECNAAGQCVPIGAAAGLDPSADDGGCGCATPGSRSSRSAWWRSLILALAGLLLRRAQRRPASQVGAQRTRLCQAS
ncbi:MAG: hypothetical protein JRI23_14360 [Deltaproteobacteria bacterium]|nr:hypothetical protein [Deltaproteobacteria bacterium]MBW2532928.1 hypothetical protein [Deltaproteobacteria bacterium]